METNVRVNRNFSILVNAVVFIILLMMTTNKVSAHCDTMDGPVVKDAKTAIEKNNINYVLKWVQPASEAELRDAFDLVMKVRKLGNDAQKLSDRYFFETLVRLHRNGEGVTYTGLKPSGTPVDERILLADKSIEINSLEPLKGHVPEAKFPELGEKFRKVMLLKNYDENNIASGREYVEAYVSFFKFAEGDEDAHNEHVH